MARLPITKIPSLSQAEVGRLEEAYKYLRNDSGGHPQTPRFTEKELHELFKDWQSRRTIVAHRTVVTFSLVVISAFWLDAPLPGFGVISESAHSTFVPWKVALLFLVFVSASAAVFWYSRMIDKSLVAARRIHIAATVARSIDEYAVIRNAAKTYKPALPERPSVDDLLEHFSIPVEIRPYLRAIEYYEDFIAPCLDTDNSIEKAVFYATIGIILVSMVLLLTDIICPVMIS